MQARGVSCHQLLRRWANFVVALHSGAECLSSGEEFEDVLSKEKVKYQTKGWTFVECQGAIFLHESTNALSVNVRGSVDRLYLTLHSVKVP